MPAPDHAVLYDADCGFCIRCLDAVMRRDDDGRLRAIAIQSAEGQRLLAPVPEGERLDSWHLVKPDGGVVSAGAAAPALFGLVRGGRLPALLTAALPPLTELGYRLVARNRGIFSRLLVLALALFVGGCSSTIQEGTELSVYLSAPAPGQQAQGGEDIADGAALALKQVGGEAAGAPVRLAVLERDGRGDAQAEAAANARIATSDSTSIAYIGESGAAGELASVPVTNLAGLLQVSPFAVDPDLLREGPGDNDVPIEFQPSGERNFGALLLDDPDTSVPAPNRQFERAFRAAYDRRPGPAAAYGYEAMALILDSIERAGDPLDRESVIEAYLATSGRESVFGTYSVDPAGIASLGQR